VKRIDQSVISHAVNLLSETHTNSERKAVYHALEHNTDRRPNSDEKKNNSAAYCCGTNGHVIDSRFMSNESGNNTAQARTAIQDDQLNAHELFFSLKLSDFCDLRSKMQIPCSFRELSLRVGGKIEGRIGPDRRT
jgi:hypothetical protein